MKYEIVIGLEVHAQLATKSKIFSWSSAAFGAEPNGSDDPVCLGMPGTLPVLNEAAVLSAVRLGLAVGSHIRPRCRFSRKHYFYPDLPKGFQISQFDEPICEGGTIRFRVRGESRTVRLERIHMEEDAGKNLHAAVGVSFVDYNRAGVPLCEIVSKPDVRSAEEAAEYLRALRTLVRYLGVCDGNMEEGSMRCDANVSLRLWGAEKFGTRTEIKNMNSFKNVRDAIDYEVRRQATLLDRGERIVQETRLWDASRGVTASMRSKEQAHDYRYFPEPDLPPLALSEAYLAAARASLPELPEDRMERYTSKDGLSPQDAGVLVAERDIADYFDAVVKAGAKANVTAKKAANWVINEVLARVDDPRRLADAELPVPAAALAELIGLVESGTLSGKLGKDVFLRMWNERRRAADIVAVEGLAQVSDTAPIEEAARRVLAAHPDELARYRGGDKKLLGFFVGAVMKETGGKANPKGANEILRRLLDQGN
ncbi:MAG TPA: Asp-tRNA(Asn)/Glu-tRNA(Gln) amidotransferase subunit GatB [Polyangia bacterium]|jgi:aspartyl-tRNA(Asn)/glutamyl-tRNA(Gln) amidotransferase subunit B